MIDHVRPDDGIAAKYRRIIDVEIIVLLVYLKAATSVHAITDSSLMRE